MKQSAGILLYRYVNRELQVLLVHPGGPFWAKKDEGAWSIPKGEFDSNTETAIDAAQREFLEETGYALDGKLIALSPVKQKSGKIVHAWACMGDADPEQLVSNFFDMEWPPKSGKMQSFPEMDKAAWFTLHEAARKIIPAQQALLHELGRILETETYSH